ncbi:MAG: DUF2235 domain-containing protein [Proteobacteria bacterium]|nr:DUF2235 domain-containing protein [Pseudomonadota bacterium]
MKRVIVMFDGTWDTPGDHTNVYRLWQSIADRDPRGTPQVSWYHEGVGTSWHGRLVGGAFGYGLSEIIRAAYQWLCETLTAGDELFVFGFSRGAYSARSFVGLIRKCGVLKSPTPDQVAAAYDLYRRRGDDPDGPESSAFRAQNSWEPRVRFIGVWDTVGSLGIPVTGLKLPFFRDYYQFHDTQLSKIVDYAYHALALDEFREDFAPTLWTSGKPGNLVVEQRWFCGAHSDVGGGSDGGRLYALALRWMEDCAQGAGLALKSVCEVEPQDIRAPIDDSFAHFMHGLYRLFKLNRRYIRTYGRTVGEVISDTVRERYALDLSPPYRPPVLKDVPDWTGPKDPDRPQVA